MTTYYVRKTGLDANAGTSAGAAWLTIDKAANTVAAGDTVYVGAGVYRELVTMDTAGTSGNTIAYIADVDGDNTGDGGGLVIISAYTNETSAPTRATCLDTNGKNFVTWDGFVFDGGSNRTVGNSTAAASGEGVVFTNCVFAAGTDPYTECLVVDVGDTAAPTGDGYQFVGCMFAGGTATINWDLNATANKNRKIAFKNCVFGPDANANILGGAGLYISHLGGSGTFGATGISATNCLFIGRYRAVYGDSTAVASQVTIKNCTFQSNRDALTDAANVGAFTSDYNLFYSNVANYTNVTGGANDDTSVTTALIGGVGDLPLYAKLGWSPYKPWEPIRLQDDSYVNGAIGLGDTATAPATDLYGSPRPMHGTVDDAGPVEGRARPEQETTTVRTGSNAIRFEGAGYHDFLIPVSPASTTTSIYGRFDSNYTGSKPKIDVLNIPGVADQTDIMTGAADTWEELTATFTPTSAGVCRLRITSQDTSATGEAFFDDLTVT